jgi:hypothetical protein
MPSALRASRDFVAHALAKVRSGLSEYERNTGLPGPEIKVEPFDASNVSTGAALIKLGTSIAASRRRRANLQEAQKDVELTRERTRAAIALLRAQAERQGQDKTPAALTSDVGPYKAGTPISDINVDLADRRLRGQGSGRGQNTGRVTAARAALGDLDAQVARESERITQDRMVRYEQEFRPRILSEDTAISGQAAWALGINPEGFNLPYASGGPTAQQRSQMIDNAFTQLRTKVLSRSRSEAEKKFSPQRRQYQSVIEQGSSGFGAPGADPNDPLGLGVNPLDLSEGGEEEDFGLSEEELFGEEAP